MAAPVQSFEESQRPRCISRVLSRVLSTHLRIFMTYILESMMIMYDILIYCIYCNAHSCTLMFHLRATPREQTRAAGGNDIGVIELQYTVKTKDKVTKSAFFLLRLQNCPVIMLWWVQPPGISWKYPTIHFDFPVIPWNLKRSSQR